MNTLIKKIYYNISIAFLLATVFVLSEQIFRIYNDSLTFNLNLKLFAEFFIINFLIISLKSKISIKLIYTIIIILIFFQYIHMNFYGSWIFPLEYIMFFQEFSEVMQTFSSVMYIAVIPSIICLVSIIIIYFILNNLRNDRLKIPYLNIIWVLYLMYMPIHSYIKKSDKGAKPDMERNSLRNTMWTLGFLTGQIIPKKLFGDINLEEQIVPTPNIIKKNPKINIIVVMGESLTSEKMSLFGYKKITTPNLDKLKGKNNFAYKEAFASGSMTSVAVPSFFNILNKPDSMPQIVSRNTCLFKMAKENGFNTYYYSAQSRNQLSGLKSFLCTSYIDEIKDATDTTGKEKTMALDETLLTYLDSVDLSKPNFIVLHQRGSHSPITGQYPAKFEISKQKKENTKVQNYLAKYENSVLYTDYVWWNIIKKVKEKSKLKTYIFFTSDHGESVGYINAHGHGDLSRKEQYIVPFVLYAHLDNNITKRIPNKKYSSHYEMGLLVGELMGYDFSKTCYQKDEHYVCGRDIQGYDGYIKVDVNGSKIKSKFLSN